MWTYLPCPSDHPILNDPKISTVAENIEKYTSSDKWSFEFTDIGKVLLYNSVDECLEFKTMAKRVSPESYKSVQMQHVLWKEVRLFILFLLTPFVAFINTKQEAHLQAGT